MSKLKSKPSLWLIREAVIKNMCRPDKDEFNEHDMKSLRVSAKKEGDSQNGIILLVGVATKLGHTKEEISAFEGIEYSEIQYKIIRYKEKLTEDRKFFYKSKLVENYLKLMR